MNQPSSHTVEDLYIKDFLSQRLVSIDGAYNKLLQDTVNEMRNGNPTKVDIDYILFQVKLETDKSVTAPIYFDPTTPNNGVTQLPATVPETRPRRDDILVKSEAFYKKLKESSGYDLPLPNEENLPDGDLHNMRDILKDLHSKTDIPRRLTTIHCFLIGKVLLAIKNKSKTTKEFLQYAKEDVKYSKSYSYFLIDFAILCMEFPRLKTVASPIRSIRTYFSHIKDMVKKESQFWT